MLPESTAVFADAAEVLSRHGEAEAEEQQLPAFPESAWRGVFGDYRDAVHGTTEASDVAHFATIWTATAAMIGRGVWTRSGDVIYPNVYLNVFGPTGDKKTTAQRQLVQILPEDMPLIREVGSTEGLGDKISVVKDGRFVFMWEEFSNLLTRGNWSGSTLFPFITEIFDCPPKWSLAYRKRPLELLKPTPSILSATTCEWFWKNTRPEDFFGGFGNRFLHLTGTRKALLPNPLPPDESRLAAVKAALIRLSGIGPTETVFGQDAKRLFAEFYCDEWRTERPALEGAALKRLHVYVRKLAMTYAACDDTLPEVTLEQLEASIAVGYYARACIQKLIDSQTVSAGPLAALEQKFLKWVHRNPGKRKRDMQQTLSKYCSSCEVFNRVLQSLERADHIEIKEGRVWPSSR